MPLTRLRGLRLDGAFLNYELDHVHKNAIDPIEGIETYPGGFLAQVPDIIRMPLTRLRGLRRSYDGIKDGGFD